MDRKSPHEDGDRAKSINFPEIVRRGLVSKTRRFSTKDTDKSKRKRRETRIAAKIPIKEQRTHNFGLLAINDRSDSVKRDNPLPSSPPPPPPPPPQRPEIFEECRRGLRALFEHLRVCALLVRFVSRVLDRVDDLERGEDVLRR
uniref:Uncharacterized protein n=1 Tax=Vespula pensylvanica TaxID=30213 RepID=A0A834KIB5_VESPE|nr:hypothetical protein H0235_014718 [Vespula pensylvanica]